LAEIMGVNDGTIRKWSSQKDTPLWANYFIETILENKNLKNKFDKLFYSKLNCKNCALYNKDNPVCNFGKKFEKNLKDYLEELKSIGSFSLKNMFSTISITKSLKSLKSSKNLSVAETIEYSIRIYKLVQKYNFKYEIDNTFERCFLNGLNPDILANILLNHIKNSLEAGSNVIKFKFEEYFYDKEKDHDFIKFKIIDNGKGIKKEMQSRIYDLNVSTKSEDLNKKHERGFGLYISKSLLQFYNGDENLVYSSPNGSIFNLIIPVKHCTLNASKEKKETL